MSDAEKRERARLRSEHWRRAHGIMPRRPAQRPCLALGISHSTYYRRRKQAREWAALQCAVASFPAASPSPDDDPSRFLGGGYPSPPR
jgi:hypothetical protein